MKIDYLDGKTGDSSEIPHDVLAALIDKEQEFVNFCKQYNISALCLTHIENYDGKGTDKGSGFQIFTSSFSTNAIIAKMREHIEELIK